MLVPITHSNGREGHIVMRQGMTSVGHDSYLHCPANCGWYLTFWKERDEERSLEIYRKHLKECVDCKRESEPSDIDSTLSERGKNYGKFEDQAAIAQCLKNEVRARHGWSHLCHDQAEAIDMILHKIARIVNGNPNFHDSWHDIVGYAKLVADRLKV